MYYICRGFNDAVNGFSDDGWSILNCDGAEDVIIAVNSTKNLSSSSNPASSLTLLGGILCAKASMLLQVSLVNSMSQYFQQCPFWDVSFYTALLAERSSSGFGSLSKGTPLRMG
jgi:homeobox-leucine zipper protein